jgi:CheY-like chemotaxis protein
MDGAKKILCVDDDIDDRFFLSNAINNINPSLEVVEASSGREAIRYLGEAVEKKDLPCMVVLDINMPFLDGKQTLEIIRTEMGLGDLPVVIFTSSDSPNDRALFNSKGVEMYTKPSDPSVFNNTVRNFLFYCS